MKPVSASLAAYLNNTTACPFMAHLFAITPVGASTVYLTSHSADITVGGHTYLAGGGSTTRPLLAFGGRVQRAGLDPGELRIRMLAADASVVWGSQRLQIAALDGVFDGAWVRVERIFGSVSGTPDTTMGTMPIHEGPVSSRRVGAFGVELVVSDGREDLARIFPGRLMQPGCPWRFGSTECGISLALHTFTGTVTSSTTTRIIAAVFGAHAASYFTHGTIEITSGLESGKKRGILVHSASSSYVDLDRPLPTAPAAGSTLTVIAGCPKTLAACGHNGVAGKFGVINSVNFGGFTFVPNPETVAP